MTEMIRARCVIVGMPEFKRRLAKLDSAAAGKALERAVRAGALPIRNEASRRAPKRTGTLRRSIHIETLNVQPRSARVAIGTDLEYAAIHEFGGVIKPKDPAGWLRFQTYDGGWHTVKLVHMPARPYLRPAFDTKKDEAAREMAAVLKQLLEAALK